MPILWEIRKKECFMFMKYLSRNWTYYKSKNFTPGFICVLHTFRRPLEWNPHIHCLISEGGHSDDGEWRNIRYFNYKLLRESFRTVLLNELEAHL